MILTLTPNPSVDRTVFLDTLTLGSVNRSTRSWNEPSGKGINVALALLSHGKTVRAVLPVGGSVGAQLRQMLSRAELDTARIPIAGEIRTNISLAQPDGTVTKINETGRRLDQTEVDALIDAVAQHLDGADWLVCGGSLPAGVPDDFYATLVELAHHKGVPVVVDSSGAPLAASLPARPDLIKPNVHELAELVQAPLATLGDVIDAAQQIRRHGVGVVLASLGSDGALLSTTPVPCTATRPWTKWSAPSAPAMPCSPGICRPPGPPATRVWRARCSGARRQCNTKALCSPRPTRPSTSSSTTLSTRHGRCMPRSLRHDHRRRPIPRPPLRKPQRHTE